MSLFVMDIDFAFVSAIFYCILELFRQCGIFRFSFYQFHHFEVSVTKTTKPSGRAIMYRS